MKQENKKQKNFNVLITGVGGQGVMTLIDILAKAAFYNGYDVKSSELHGLSQRGGMVATYISFGKNKVFSPLFKRGDADLILGLELLEGLRGMEFFSAGKTKVLINNYSLPFIGITPPDEVIKNLKKIGGDNLEIVEASKICKEKLGKEVVSGLYLLGYAVYKNLLTIKPEAVIKAIEKSVPEKFLDLNLKAFKLSRYQ